MNNLQRPVLIGTTTIEKSELLAALLSEYKIPYQLSLSWDFFILKRNAVFTIEARPTILHPAGIWRVRTGPAVGGLTRHPICDVKTDYGVALIENAVEGIVEIQKVANPCA